MSNRLNENKLFTKNHKILEYGYSYSFFKDFDKKHLYIKKLFIREEDSYNFYNDNLAFKLEIIKDAISIRLNIFLLDLKVRSSISKSFILPKCVNKINFPISSENGDIILSNKKMLLKIKNSDYQRELTLNIKNFTKYSDLNLDIKITNYQNKSGFILSQGKKEKHFIIKNKINNFIYNGYINIGLKKYNVNEIHGYYDFIRNFAPYKKSYYNANIMKINRKIVNSFFFGCNLCNDSVENENFAFINEIPLKLPNVMFLFQKTKNNKNDFSKEVKIIDSNNLIDINFKPLLISSSRKLISKTYLIYGYFSGTIKTNSKKITLENVLGNINYIEDII